MMKRLLPLHKTLHYHSTRPTRNFNFLFKPSEWKSAITEAEKLVGYSTSFLSLRCLLSDELSNVAVQVKKLVGTGHPLLKTVQKLFQEGKQSKELRGLLILLLSKAAGPAKQSLTTPQSIVSGIYQSQRTLAEITEIIHTASLVHRSVIDLDQCSPDNDPGGHDNDDDADGGYGGGGIFGRRNSVRCEGFQGTYEDLEFGNKMSTLSGDFLLASASTNLASLNNSKVVETISTAIQDLMNGEFLRTTQKPLFNHHDNHLTNHTPFNQSEQSSLIPPTNQPLSIKNWEEFTFLTAGSLLARGCQSVLELANHRPEMQQKAFDFGRLMALAYQLKEEITNLSTPPNHHTNLFFAPLIIYTQHVLNSLPKGQNTAEDREVALRAIYSRSPRELYHSIASDAVVMGEVGGLCGEYGRLAIEALQVFEPNPAKTLLVDMVNAVVKI